jgi:hypothetical protein
MKRKTYDPQSYDLAAAFLGDHPALDVEWRRQELAIRIQGTIEDFIDCATEAQKLLVT